MSRPSDQTSKHPFGITDDIVSAQSNPGLVEGICVHVNELKSVLYAGPIVGQTKVRAGTIVLMNPNDFAKFKTFVEKKRN